MPYLEFKNEIIYWGFPKITDESYLITNGILIIANIVFVIFYIYQYFSRKRIITFVENKDLKK